MPRSSDCRRSIHFHTVALDGVFSVAGPVPVFHHLPGPTDEEVAGIVEAVAQAVISDLRAHRYLTEEMGDALEPSSLDPVFAAFEQLAAAVAASAVMRIAFGERAGLKVRHIGKGFGFEDETPFAKGRRCFSANGKDLDGHGRTMPAMRTISRDQVPKRETRVSEPRNAGKSSVRRGCRSNRSQEPSATRGGLWEDRSSLRRLISHPGRSGTVRVPVQSGGPGRGTLRQRRTKAVQVWAVR